VTAFGSCKSGGISGECVRLPSLSLRGGRRPTWRPERAARGSALGVQSREGTADSHRLSIKAYQPIASVAAFPAQPLAALPPYGCGVPFTGGECLWQLQISACSADRIRHCRGAACRSRRCTCSPYRPPSKWHAPIASVAAFPAQPLAALPPYGCGVPFTGVERLWQLQISAQ